MSGLRVEEGLRARPGDRGRFRVVVPLLDKTFPSVFAALDVVLRRLDGAPTYILTEYVPRNIFGLLCPPAICGPVRSGESIRLAQALSGAGVSPLA